MKKLIIYTILILLNTQAVYAIEEVFGHDKSLDQPGFEDLSNQFFIPSKSTEDASLDTEKEQPLVNNQQEETPEASSSGRKKTLPPVQKMRLKVKKYFREKKYASELKNNPESFELEADKTAESTEPEAESKLILECKTMEYFADKKEIHAQGGAKLIFPENNTTATAETMIYNQKENMIKMINNVVITKGDDVITGDFMQIDMNEEIGMLDNMKTSNYSIEMKAEKGYMYGDKTIQENGHLKVEKSFKINLSSGMYGNPNMQIAKEDEYNYADMVHDSKFVIKSNHIIVNAKKDHDVITLKKLELYKNGKRILKMPSTTLYTNKAQDYVEGNYLEFGSKPRFGVFAGPGLVLELPGGSTLKAMPILNYKGGIGIGGLGRFRSATNMTEFGYGSAANMFMLKGRQKLDENLFLQYGMNTYLEDGFIGSGWSKYAANLVYEKGTNLNSFLGKKRPLSFVQRISAGYIQDDGDQEGYDYTNRHLYDKDKNKIFSYNIGTARFRYMLHAQQTLYKYDDYKNLFFADFSIATQGSASVYGTGQTQFIGRIGPRLRTQCKYWVQEIGYYLSGYHDDSAVPLYDGYRYGKSNVYLRESIRLHKLLMLSWYGSANLSNDAPDGRILQESRFVIGLGPDDIRLNLGMDVIRQNTYVGVTINMDAKDTEVSYDKLEIKNPEKLGKSNEEDLSEPVVYEGSKTKTTASRMEKCQVFDIEDSSLRMDNEKI